ncbi:MAG: cation diffusion facilitator family transporter [Lentihominibacter sp.]|nr:cation diffusion facilitator family transporter [Clostridiales bacterium]MDY2679301.1 cation diffusion facilitator family transporter [Lentihominibacter sp.]
MGKLLIRIFVKDHENTDDPRVRERYGKFAGVVGIVSNLILCIMKILIGLVSRSIAIIADGINNLADASSSIITLVGFKLASQPEDEDHPYGHARIEYLTGLFISIVIIVIGLQLLRTSIDKILHPDPLEFSCLTIIILVAAILIKLWQSLFNRSIGRKIRSVTLMATAADSRNDVISTSAVLISVIVGKFTGIQIDGYMGCLVALFIIWSGIQLVRETTSPLLGEAPDQELVDSIAEIVKKEPGVLGIHDLMVHNYGPGKIFASMHIEVDADGDLMESHDMIDNIEKRIKDELHVEFVVHMDPVKTDDPLITKMKKIIADALLPLDGVDNIHDFRIVPGPTHTNIIFDVVLAADCSLSEKEITGIAAEAARSVDNDFYVVITFDHAYTRL